MADLTVRFDDVCVNSDLARVSAMSGVVRHLFPSARVIWAISPLVCDPEMLSENRGTQPVYPRIIEAQSDPREWYRRVRRAGAVESPPWVTRASHGLIHVDHRLISEGEQAMSVMTSCALVGARVFVPPFNKWTPFMDALCLREGLELVRWEDGWRACEYNEPETFSRTTLWYTHDWAWRDVAAFSSWFSRASESR